MSDRLAVLTETHAVLRQAADRLAATRHAVAHHFPLTAARLTALSQSEQERLDAYAIRYARCQDLLFPAMRALARAQLEPKADGPFLALHALMQKQGVVTRAADWERQRALRNAVGHEYPDPDSITDILLGGSDDRPDCRPAPSAVAGATLATGGPGLPAARPRRAVGARR